MVSSAMKLDPVTVKLKKINILIKTFGPYVVKPHYLIRIKQKVIHMYESILFSYWLDLHDAHSLLSC